MSHRSFQYGRRIIGVIAAVLALWPRPGAGQDIPLISGGGGFITSTKGGNTTYIPVIAPVLVAALGSHLLVESRATVLESYFPRGGGQPGYKHDGFLGLSFLQADIIAAPHLTVVAGEFLTPFGTYNERLSPIWISNFEDAPLIYGLGTMGSGSSVGGMLRGSAWSNSSVNISYAAFFSVASTNQQFDADRAAGGQGGVYFPNSGLEIGASFDRLLQDPHENFAGAHLWWGPPSKWLCVRSEFARSVHAQGYWIESAYRLARARGENSLFGRLEPVLRMQQTFRSSPDKQDGLPPMDTQRVDFALDYHLPHEVRLNTSYSRELSSSGNRNIWQTGLVYRFLFPTWRGK